MQTNFTLAQLADPGACAAEKILRTCVHRDLPDLRVNLKTAIEHRAS